MKHLTLPAWKWSKRLTMIGAIIPLLILLAFMGAISLIDFNQYKPQLEQEVSERAGYEFKIEGALEVSIFPFSFSAGDVALKNSPQIKQRFEYENMLAIKQVRAELSVWELLVNKKLEITSLELIEPKLFLLKDAYGHNWQRLPKLTQFSEPLLQSWQRQSAVASAADLAAFQQALRPVNQQAVQTATAPESSPQQSWHFDNLIIKHGAFEIEDRRAKHQASVSNLNLLAFDITLGQPFHVRTDFDYRNAMTTRDYHFDLSADLDISGDFMQWQVSDWQGISNIKLPSESKVPEMRLVTQGAQFSLDLMNEQIVVSRLQLKTLGSTIESSFSGHYGGTPVLNGSMSAADVNPRQWARHLGITLPGFEDKTALSVLNGQFNWSLAESKWSFNQLDINIDSTQLEGDIWHEGEGQDTRYLFDLKVSDLNLDRYRATTDDGFLAALQSEKQAKNGEQAAPAATNKPSRPADKTSADTTYLPLAVPVTTLRSLNANGQLQLAQLTYSGITLEQVDIELQAQQGQLQLAPFDAQLYQGKLSSKLEMDVTGETPAYNWYGQLQQVDLGSILQAGWQLKPLGGRLNTHFKLATSGSNQQVLLQNLSGELTATAASGHFYGMDVEKLLLGKASTATDKTPYQALQIKGKLKNGIYQATQFSVDSQRFSGSGFGSIDLNRAEIDSTLKLRLTAPPANLKHLKGMLIPVGYKGPLEGAQWSVNLESLLKDPGNQQKLVSQLKALLQ